MAVFKCKMCGSPLKIQPGETVYECEYCGTRQTIPSVDEEYLQNLFNRANNLRMNAEFDKAADIYERIIQEDSTEAEAYWGLVLCKYGIEYVEDPATHKRVPTCHRTSYKSVVSDEDFRNAVLHADKSQKSIYESEAKAIDEIQKGILSIAAFEADYDIFICYKEADENGKRTVDSTIANELYYDLTLEGFKVFYAAITLEDKLGTEYEPYIFSALNSAKVMLVIGTKPEYFNAVWVKNEWSRFLKLMQTDHSRTLIPCYRDMDAYDLPEEFAHLQAEDMSKIGFENDIIRGIRKIIVQPDNTPAIKNSIERDRTYFPNTRNMASLLKRIFLFLEDEDWEKADEYCEQVLDSDPENAQAYVGKLMAELHVSHQEDLADCDTPFDQNGNYKKAIRFGDDALKNEMESYTAVIKERNRREKLDSEYNEAVQKLNAAISEKDFIEAAELFERIPNWKDASKMGKLARAEAEEKYNIRSEEERRKKLEDEKVKQEEEKEKAEHEAKKAKLEAERAAFEEFGRKKQEEEKEKQEAEQAEIEKKKRKKRRRRIRIFVFIIVVIITIGIYWVYTPGMFENIIDEIIDDIKNRFQLPYSAEEYVIDSEAAGTDNPLEEPLNEILNETLIDETKQNVLMANENRQNNYFYLDDSTISLINSITFCDTLSDMPSDAWDVSYDQDGSVMAWTVQNGNEYDMYIAGEGGVWANSDSSLLFAGFDGVTFINFNDCFYTDNVRDMNQMFRNCSSLKSLDLSSWNTSSVTNMFFMFCDCDSLESLDLSSWDTSGVTDMDFMFYNCFSLESLDVSGWNTSSVRNMACMFEYCSSLKSLDVSGWDTSGVTDMDYMFYDCLSLKDLDVSGWDTSGVTDMKYMFYYCLSLESLDVSSWDTSSVADMSGMFKRCSSLKSLDVSGWDISNVADMSYMFADCPSLESLDVSGWDMSNADTSGMFDGTIWA